jgi:hypothetical protein
MFHLLRRPGFRMTLEPLVNVKVSVVQARPVLTSRYRRIVLMHLSLAIFCVRS